MKKLRKHSHIEKGEIEGPAIGDSKFQLALPHHEGCSKDLTPISATVSVVEKSTSFFVYGHEELV